MRTTNVLAGVAVIGRIITQQSLPYYHRIIGHSGPETPALKMKAGKPPPCRSECCKENAGASSSQSPRRGRVANYADLLKVAARPPTPVRDCDGACDEIIFVDGIDELDMIMEDGVQLAVWRQSSLPNFIKALSDASIDPEDLPAFEGMIPTYPGMVSETLKKYLYVPYNLRSHEGRRRVLDEDGVDELVGHIDRLAQVFASIARSSGLVGDCEGEVPFVNIKLSVIGGDGCRFWHQDYVPFRLCTTFRGPCTEWVPPAYSKATLQDRELDSDQAQSLTHYDVALFKGRGGLDSDEESGSDEELYDHPGIVHRSPRTSGSGIHRLLLVIDLPQEGWHF